MLTDEQLIQQIRTELHDELAALEPPADLLRRLAARAAEPRPPARVPRMHLGGMVVAIGAACAIAVAVVAVVSLGHRPPSRVVTGPQSSGSRSTLGALEAKLAVLRRPPTPADRGFPAYDRPRQTVIRTLFAVTINTPTVGPMRAFVIVARSRVPRIPQSSSRLRPGRDLVSAIAIPESGRGISNTGFLGVSSLSNPAGVASGLSTSGSEVNPGRGVTIGIVPDGVSRVQWVFSGAGFGIAHPRPVTVTPQVHNNVAVAPVEPGEGPLAHATWYAYDGQVIRQAVETAAARQQLQTIAAVNASRGRPIAPQLRDHYSLFRSTPPDTPAEGWLLPTPGTTGGYIGQMHLNYWQTRYIPNATGLDGAGLWITPGTDGLCISDPQTNFCGKLSDRILDGFAGGATSGPREETIAGLVPDGNPTVTLILADGTKRTVPVTDHHVYEATVPGHVVAIINRNASGTTIRQSLR